MIIEKLRYYFFEFLPNFSILILLEFLSGFFPIIFAMIYYKSISKNNKTLLFYAILIFVFEILNNVFSAFSLNNHDIYLSFYILESLILYHYFKLEVNEELFKWGGLILVSIISILFLVNIFSKIDLMDDVSSSTQSLFFIFITIVNYNYILSKLKINFLTKSTFFWVNTASFIYFTGKFFVSLYLLEIFTNSTKADLLEYWRIVSVLIIIHRILIAIGISKIENQNN